MPLFENPYKKAVRLELDKNIHEIEIKDEKRITTGDFEKFIDNVNFSRRLNLISPEQAENYRARARDAYEEFRFAQIFSPEERKQYEVMNEKIKCVEKKYNDLMEKHLTPGGEERWENYIKLQNTAKELASLRAERGGFYVRAVMRTSDVLSTGHTDNRRMERVDDKEERRKSMAEYKGQIKSEKANDGAKQNDMKDRQLHKQEDKKKSDKTVKIDMER